MSDLGQAIVEYAAKRASIVFGLAWLGGFLMGLGLAGMLFFGCTPARADTTTTTTTTTLDSFSFHSGRIGHFGTYRDQGFTPAPLRQCTPERNEEEQRALASGELCRMRHQLRKMRAMFPGNERKRVRRCFVLGPFGWMLHGWIWEALFGETFCVHGRVR